MTSLTVVTANTRYRKLCAGTLLLMITTMVCDLSTGATASDGMPKKIVHHTIGSNISKSEASSWVGLQKITAPVRANNAPRQVLLKSFPYFARDDSSNRLDGDLKIARVIDKNNQAFLMLNLLLSGHLSVEEAWQSKKLSVEQISYILEKEVGVLGNFLVRDPDYVGAVPPDPLRRALATLLLQQDKRFSGILAPDSGEYSQHEKQQKSLLRNIPRRLRMWVGEYLVLQKDARSTVVLQSIFDDGQADREGDGEVMVTGDILSSFYRNKGDYKSSAIMWMRTGSLVSKDVWKSNLILEAARDYKQLGDLQKVEELYHQVPKNGQGWVSGALIFEEATALIARGKHEEARELLKQPISGPNADQIEVALLTTLGSSYYQTGDMENARRFSQQAVDNYNSLRQPGKGLGLEYQVELAKGTLLKIEQNNAQPISDSP